MSTSLEAILKERVQSALRQNSESDNIEFKAAQGGMPKEIWKTITAFSNTPGGGLIVFGVKENSRPPRKLEIIGVPDPSSLQEKIISFIEHKIINNSPYDLKILELNNKTLLALVLGETNKESKPCYNSDLGMHRGACIRVGNVNRLITEEELRAFLRYSPAYNYDKSPLVTVNLTHLSTDKVQEFLEKSAKRRGRKYPQNQKLEQVFLNLGIAAQKEDLFSPTLAGYLLFAQDVPQDIEPLSRYIVRCVSYAGKSVSAPIIDQQDVLGTLDQQVDDSMKFLLRNIRTSAKIVGAKREETPEYPELALREIIVNALIHRDYSNTGTYVQVVVFQDRIEISNPGTLPPGVTVENLKMSQFSRNGVIAKIMRDMDYMEEFGRGIDLIYSQMNEWDLVEPLFKNSSNSFKVTLLGTDYTHLNERQIRFWNILQDSNHLTASVAHECFPDVSRATINNDLRKMIDIGLIKAKGSSFNTYYEPEY